MRGRGSGACPRNGQVGVGDRVDARPDEVRRAPASAAGRRRGTGRPAGRGRRRRRRRAGPPRDRRRGRPSPPRSGPPECSTATEVAARGVSVRDLAAGHDPPAGRPQVVGHRRGHGAVVDDAGRRRVQRRDAGRVRLDLAQLVGADPAQARHLVGAAAPLELVEAGQLALASVATITLPSRRASMPRSSQ